jgi:predicted YcjX-like family ATPase
MGDIPEHVPIPAFPGVFLAHGRRIRKNEKDSGDTDTSEWTVCKHQRMDMLLTFLLTDRLM